MWKLLTFVGVLIMITTGTFAKQKLAKHPGTLATKFRLEIAESGSFLDKTGKELGTKEAAAMITAVCAVFETDCSKEATAGTKAIKTMYDRDDVNGENHNGLVAAPAGYEICRAKIDMKNASVDGQSSFSGEIVRDKTGNGLGYYAHVPKHQPEGHSVEADLYIEFVKAGTLKKNNCWPASDHSPAAHLWDCHNGDCKMIKPEAHYP